MAWRHVACVAISLLTITPKCITLAWRLSAFLSVLPAVRPIQRCLWSSKCNPRVSMKGCRHSLPYARTVEAHRTTEPTSYPRASTQKHRHCCGKTRQTVMETAHFPDTWGNSKHPCLSPISLPTLVPHPLFSSGQREHLVFQEITGQLLEWLEYITENKPSREGISLITKSFFKKPYFIRSLQREADVYSALQYHKHVPAYLALCC